MLTNAKIKALQNAARKTRRQAYAPYSGFKVGAAVLTTGNRIFTGVNVENASYGLTICAERVAVCAAINAGQRRLQAVLICAPRMVPPCGACLQVLAEFAAPDCPIFLDTAGKRAPKLLKLDQLLPHAFTASSAHLFYKKRNS